MQTARHGAAETALVAASAERRVYSGVQIDVEVIIDSIIVQVKFWTSLSHSGNPPPFHSAQTYGLSTEKNPKNAGQRSMNGSKADEYVTTSSMSLYLVYTVYVVRV